MAQNYVSIAGREIGPSYPPYIVAEMSGNHNGDFGRALALIEAAAQAGSDAVKLQTYTADTITIDHDGPQFRIKGGIWNGRRLYDLYQEAHTPWDWHRKLFEKGHELGVHVFSAPFDATAVDFLLDLDTPAFKIASFEIGDLQLIERCAVTGKPLIMSTGMANKSEIAEAVNMARRSGCEQLILLHCVSGYPTKPKDANLHTISDLTNSFSAVSGLSDHTCGSAVSVAGVALGACVIEKHFTLSRADGGPDAAFSLEPDELRDLIHHCRTAWDALGKVHYDLKASEKGNQIFRRSLYVVADVPAGEPLTLSNIRSIRPGFGMPPKNMGEVLGRLAARDLKRGDPLEWDMIETDQ